MPSKLIHLLTTESLVSQYQEWRSKALYAYIKQMRLIEVATDPTIRKTVAAYQEMGRLEEELIQEEQVCREMAHPYLVELHRRGLYKDDLV